VAFGQDFDIAPLASLPIVQYEFLSLFIDNRTLKKSWVRVERCPEHKSCHAYPCAAYNHVANTSNARDPNHAVVIVVDNMGYSDAKVDDFMSLPGVMPKHYFIHDRYVFRLCSLLAHC
jgi:hypothetical protein